MYGLKTYNIYIKTNKINMQKIFILLFITSVGISSWYAFSRPLPYAPCHDWETSKQCQQRLGDAWEVIYDPQTNVARGEIK